MHILVTNDDGVLAPGLYALVKELRLVGNVSILAPDRNWSGGGHVKTLDRPLRIKEVQLADGSLALASDGAPSDCVALALLGFFPEKTNLVISGINPAANIGHDVTYSGTVTAAMESMIWGVPAIAVSLDTQENHLGVLDYTTAARITRKIVQAIQSKLAPGILLNVNIPYLPEDQIKGVQITRQGLRVYRDKLEQRIDPRGRPYFWIGGDSPTGIAEKDTDYGALTEGYVSITPLQLDLTDYAKLQLLDVMDWDNPERIYEIDQSLLVSTSINNKSSQNRR